MKSVWAGETGFAAEPEWVQAAEMLQAQAEAWAEVEARAEAEAEAWAEEVEVEVEKARAELEAEAREEAEDTDAGEVGVSTIISKPIQPEKSTESQQIPGSTLNRDQIILNH